MLDSSNELYRTTLIAMLVAVGMLLFVSASAAEEPEPPGLQPLPDAAPDIEDENVADALEQDPGILGAGSTVIEEIRLRGRIVMFKVIPQGAAPYYLVDRDGDGDFDTRFNEFNRDHFDTEIIIPRWKIKTW